MVWACELFRIYLLPAPFTCYTDHSALVWLFRQTKPMRISRWILRLSQFDFTCIHKPGKLNYVCDAMSRAPLPSDAPYELRESVEYLYKLFSKGGEGFPVASSAASTATAVASSGEGDTLVEPDLLSKADASPLKCPSNLKKFQRNRVGPALRASQQLLKQSLIPIGGLSDFNSFPRRRVALEKLRIASAPPAIPTFVLTKPVPAAPVSQAEATLRRRTLRNRARRAHRLVCLPFSPAQPLTQEEKSHRVLLKAQSGPKAVRRLELITARQMRHKAEMVFTIVSALSTTAAFTPTGACYHISEFPSLAKKAQRCSDSLPTATLLPLASVPVSAAASEKKDDEPLVFNYPRSVEYAASLAEIRRLQLADPVLAPLYRFHVFKEAGLKLSAADKVNFVARDDLLFYQPHDNARRSRKNVTELYLPLVVPTVLQVEFLRSFHNASTSAHVGVAKTLSRIRRRFYWSGIEIDVTRWINGCVLCKRRKTVLNANAGEFMQFVEPERPFSMLGVDFVGPFRESEHGNKYLLTATCFYSRWPIAVPVRDCTAETAAKALFAHVFSIFGVPDKILTDRGSHFNLAI